MPLIIQEDPNKYPLPPEGLHKAVCVDVVDLGDLDTKFGSKHKLSVIFELEELDNEGKRFLVGKRYTWSLNEKSNLRKDLERWLGKKFKSEELMAGFDLEELLGLNATLFISHNVGEERTYANIETILPIGNGKGTDKYALKPSADYLRVIHREGYKEPALYAASLNGTAV
jgi:hypothetical protein